MTILWAILIFLNGFWLGCWVMSNIVWRKNKEALRQLAIQSREREADLRRLLADCAVVEKNAK